MRVLATIGFSFSAGVFLAALLPWDGWQLYAAAGAALLALGMLGVLVIWILSTMLPTAVPVQAAGSAPNSWEVWDEIVYEFGPFVRARRLQALLAALGACALAGGGLLIASARRNAPKG